MSKKLSLLLAVAALLAVLITAGCVTTDSPQNTDGMVTITTADAKLYIPMCQIVQIAKELERIEKELEKARNNLAGIEAKLSNENFTARAPENVVNAEREKAEKARVLIALLEQSAAILNKV